MGPIQLQPMDEDSSAAAPPRRTRFQFGLRSLFELTFLVACILAVAKWIGPEFGWISAVPLGIVAVVVLSTHWRCMLGTVIGFAILVVAVICLSGIKTPGADLPKAIVTVGSFGGAFGASIHAIILRQRGIGVSCLVASIIVVFCLLVLG